MKKLLIVMMLTMALLLLFAVPMFAVEMPDSTMLTSIVDSVEALTPGDKWAGATDFKSLAPGNPLIMLSDNYQGEISANGGMGTVIEAPTPAIAKINVRQLIYDKERAQAQARTNLNGESAGDSALRVHGEPGATMG